MSKYWPTKSRLCYPRVLNLTESLAVIKGSCSLRPGLEVPSMDCKHRSKEKHQDGLCEGCMSQSNMLQSPWFPNSILRADLCTPLVPSCNAEQ